MTAEIPAAPITTAVRAPERGPEGRPLLLFLHGFGSHERDLPALAPRLGDSWDWISVRAPYELSTGGAAWFPLPASGAIDRGSLDRQAIHAAVTGLNAFLDAHTAGQPILPIGFSQGGLMVTELLRSGRNDVVAGAILSGFVDPDPRSGDAQLLANRPKVFFGRGTADPVIPESWFEAADAWLARYTQVTSRRYGGLGHAVSDPEIADLREFLDALGQ